LLLCLPAALWHRRWLIVRRVVSELDAGCCGTAWHPVELVLEALA